MLKIVSFTLFLASANAFWTGCNIPGVITPDRIESPFCGATTCTVARGQTLTSDTWFTPVRAHASLNVIATGFGAGGIGVNLPIPPPHDNACGNLFNPGTGAASPCPTTPNQQKRWHLAFPIPAAWPALNNARVRFELREGGVLEMCADINQVTIT